MCLYVFKRKEEVVWETHSRVFYKVIALHQNQPYSPFMRFKLKPGWNEATLGKEETDGIINFGIHVYSSKEKADRVVKEMNSWGDCFFYKVIPVLCFYDDLIAQGSSLPSSFVTEEAVFKRIFIESKDLG